MMTYPVLQVVNRVAHLVLSVVIQDSVGVRPVKGPLYLQHKRTRHRAKISLRGAAVGQKTLNYAARSDLVTKHKSGDPSHELGEEDEREKHGVLHGDSRAKHGIQGPTATSNTPRSHHSSPPPHHHPSSSLPQPLTSFSIHGLPLQVAKHPNRPKTMMTVPVPMRTYGALVELSAIREMYGPSINFPHTPTASRMAPVICV